MTTAVREIALGVISDIEKYGHYQELPGQTLYRSDRSGGGQCCVLVNPTYGSAHHPSFCNFERAFRGAAASYGAESTSIAAISDCLSTYEVLDILWMVALG